ncbi:MAG: cupin domain-containing protein [Oscillospiraceae bacterium]
MDKMQLHQNKELAMKFENGLARENVLNGSFKDVQFFKCTIQSGCSFQPELYAKEKFCQLFVCAEGIGTVHTPREIYKIDEVSLFIPEFDTEPIVFKAEEQLTILQIIVQMDGYDRREMKASRITLPRFRRVSEAWTYTENFKTPGIRSCILIEHRMLGRLSMGVVTGKGPAVVGEHIHNELEQWYYVLPKASFTYTSGAEKTSVYGGDLFHIPRGLPHGSESADGVTFDYLWFELCVDGYPGQIE